jgi:putative copper export protein
MVDTLVRFIHLLAAAYWLGGLIMLASVVVVGLRVLDRDQFRALLIPLARLFAWGALVAWLILLLSGYLLASRRISSLDALSTTPYGRQLEVKLFLVALTIVATAVHVVLGRSRSRAALTISRAMAVLAFVFTASVFFAAARLASG